MAAVGEPSRPLEPANVAPAPGSRRDDTPPEPLTPIRPIRGISRAIMILVGIVGVVSATGGLITPAVANRATDFLEGRATAEEFERSYAVLTLARVVILPATLAAFAVIGIWMYRMSRNVRAYGRETVWAPLFGVVGWLLPPALFVIPLLMLRELWKASTPRWSGGTDAWKRQPENPMLWAWWLLFGVASLGFGAVQLAAIAGGSDRGTATTESLAEGIEGAGAFSVTSGSFQLVTAIVWIVFVRQLAARHTALTRER